MRPRGLEIARAGGWHRGLEFGSFGSASLWQSDCLLIYSVGQDESRVMMVGPSRIGKARILHEEPE